jgi:catechol 2,3-dioxygenase-like lactoylglutathione lyase family enzyme
VIALAGLDHVALTVADLDEAAGRWALQFGLHVRERGGARAILCCDDEECALELIEGDQPGFHHVAWELADGCAPGEARRELERLGVAAEQGDRDVWLADADGNRLQLVPRRRRDPRPAHARAPSAAPLGHPRRLGHVNFLTGALAEQQRFYTEVLGMRLTDWLGEEGVWLHTGRDHHVMALVAKGYPHFHHLAFELVDIGQLRDALDHLGRHGRWLGWGPVRHGIGGNIAAYVRIVEEPCFVELYCDMEQLAPDHRPRRWPDDRFSSNTWGPLPPRSYFRFDEAAVASERDSLEMLGVPLPPEPAPAPARPAPAPAASSKEVA